MGWEWDMAAQHLTPWVKLWEWVSAVAVPWAVVKYEQSSNS